MKAGPANKGTHGRDIFVKGEYVQHFKPDDRWNPFRKIYKQKKMDTINIVNTSGYSKTILDLGGGMGRVSLALAEAGENDIVLADISIDMLKLVTGPHGSDRVTVVNADAHTLPFHDNLFDYVIGLDLLCHLEHPEKALNEFYRVLKENGILILDSTNSNPFWTLFYPRYLGKNPLDWIRTMRYHGVSPDWKDIVKHYSKNTFLTLLKEAGFKVMQQINYGPFICPKWHLTVSRKVL